MTNMVVNLKISHKLSTEVQMLNISAGTTQSEYFPVKGIIEDWQRYIEYSIVSEEPCCSMMTHAISKGVIGFSNDVGCYGMEFDVYNADDEYVGTDILPLNYCPFCGATPKYEVVEQTKEYPVLEDYKYKVFKTVVEPQYEAVEVSRKKLTGVIERNQE